MKYKKFLPFLLAFVLPLLVVYAWWGGFRTVEISEAVRGPYTYAYLESVGDYSKLTDKAMEARSLLNEAKVARGLPITVLLSNPDLVPMSKRVGRTGYLVEAGTTVKPPLKIDTIPARRVLLAQVNAAPLLAPSRIYAALDRYTQSHGGGIHMPTVELYESTGTLMGMGLMTVEMPVQ